MQFNEFALAAYLVLAQPGVYFQYQWWYSSNNGMIPCDDPNDCAFPPGFYPAYQNALGAPLGPYVKAGYTYTRSFEHATAHLDLLEPGNSYVHFA